MERNTEIALKSKISSYIAAKIYLDRNTTDYTQKRLNEHLNEFSTGEIKIIT